MSDDDLARVLQVNRIREEAEEDAAWVLAFYRPLIEGGMPPEDAFAATMAWMDAHLSPPVVEVSATYQREDEDAG